MWQCQEGVAKGASVRSTESKGIAIKATPVEQCSDPHRPEAQNNATRNAADMASYKCQRLKA